MMNVESILKDAMARHQAGDLEAAEVLYRTILSQDPVDPDALNLLGVLSLQCGKLDEAGQLIKKAIDINPLIAEYHFNLGETFTHQGKKDDAIESYRRSLKCNPHLKLAQDRLTAMDKPFPSKFEDNDNDLNHLEVVQQVINHTKAKTYLEIGIDAGECFLNINAKKKYGVDPTPSQDFIDKLLTNVMVTHLKCLQAGPGKAVHLTLSATNENPPSTFKLDDTCECYYLTSDAFFARHAPLIFCQQKIDVAFVDGLHTYHQSYQDISNAMDFLATGGVILMNDCNPPSEASAFPAGSWEAAARMNLPGWNGNWCGDVWKSIVRLRTARNDLRVFVLDCDFGIGVVCRGEAENMLDMTMPEIERLSFNHLNSDRRTLLNLKPQSYLSEFLQTLV